MSDTPTPGPNPGPRLARSITLGEGIGALCALITLLATCVIVPVLGARDDIHNMATKSAVWDEAAKRTDAHEATLAQYSQIKLQRDSEITDLRSREDRNEAAIGAITNQMASISTTLQDIKQRLDDWRPRR